MVLAPTLSERLENITLRFFFFFLLMEDLVICCATLRDLVPSKENLLIPLLAVQKSSPLLSPCQCFGFHCRVLLILSLDVRDAHLENTMYLCGLGEDLAHYLILLSCCSLPLFHLVKRGTVRQLSVLYCCFSWGSEDLERKVNSEQELKHKWQL